MAAALEGGGDEGADEGGPEQDEGRAALPARGRSPPCTGGWGWTGLDSWGGRDDKAPPSFKACFTCASVAPAGTLIGSAVS
jgi:hypothetical protein